MNSRRWEGPSRLLAEYAAQEAPIMHPNGAPPPIDIVATSNDDDDVWRRRPNLGQLDQYLQDNPLMLKLHLWQSCPL